MGQTQTYGYIERSADTDDDGKAFWHPDYQADYLYETVGYAISMAVEQENGRDQLWFDLEIYPDADGRPVRKTFCIYLDVGTTVALAQFQLLRDALSSGGDVVVRVEFNYSDEDTESATMYAYRVELQRVDSLGGGAMPYSFGGVGSALVSGAVTVSGFFDHDDYVWSDSGWRVHKL